MKLTGAWITTSCGRIQSPNFSSLQPVAREWTFLCVDAKVEKHNNELEDFEACYF